MDKAFLSSAATKMPAQLTVLVARNQNGSEAVVKVEPRSLEVLLPALPQSDLMQRLLSSY